MEGITIIMAIVDFIPVILFFIASVILMRDLYNKLVKGAFALLAAGSIMVLISGIYKASWKILYACSICDFEALNTAFFPMQSPGFLLTFFGLCYLIKRLRKGAVLYSSTMLIPLYSSKLIFILGQILGSGGVQLTLCYLAKKMKRLAAVALFIVSFLAMLTMGYLSAKFDNSSSMHWTAQFTNILSQGAFLLGVIDLHKHGLDKMEWVTENA